MPPDWVRNLYDFAVKPTMAFYFQVPLDVAIGRILGGRAELKYYEAGMDLGLSPDIRESFRQFQGEIMQQYDSMVDEFDLTVMDAMRPIPEQQHRMRELVKPFLKGIHKRDDKQRRIRTKAAAQE